MILSTLPRIFFLFLPTRDLFSVRAECCGNLDRASYEARPMVAVNLLPARDSSTVSRTVWNANPGRSSFSHFAYHSECGNHRRVI